MIALTVTLSLLLAFLLGFAAHRASICTVKAVLEVLTSRRGYMLASFIKTVLWAMTAVIAAAWVLPEGPSLASGYWPSVIGISGGFLFGMGAAVNGGCAVSTLNKLGSGDLAMLATLSGFVGGLFLAFILLAQSPVLVEPAAAGLPLTSNHWTLALSGLAVLWLLFELRRLWAGRDRQQNLRQRAFSERYRLSTAALVIGLCGGAIYVLNGPWVYTASLASGVRNLLGAGPGPSFASLILFVALLAGIVFSAWQRKALRLRAAPPSVLLRHALGGFAMGAGAACIPGGNDNLVLSAMPLWLPHALPTYIALLIGVAVTLLVMKRVTGMNPRLDCSGDLCTED